MKDRRICIVTGAARGIGKGIAVALVARGYQLVLADLLFADPDVCAAIKIEIGAETVLIQTDLTQPK